MSDTKCIKIGKVWGFSSNAPNMLPIIDSLTHNSDPRFSEYWPSGHVAWAGIPNGGTSDSDPTFPAIPAFVNSATFAVLAAKVPTSFPYGCSTEPITSSADPRANDQWFATLANIADVIDRGSDPPEMHVNDCHAVCWSRAIYVDGRQEKVVYGITSLRPGFDPTGYDDELSLDHTSGTVTHCDHAIVDIASASSVLKSIEYVGLVAGTPMGDLYQGAALPSSKATFRFFDDYVQCYPNCRFVGNDHYFFSQYSPQLDICNGDGGNTFIVGRVRYSDLQFVCGGSGDVANHSTGPYIIVLPSCRAFLLSHPPVPPHGSFSDEASRLPDEPWVTAIKLENNPDYPEGESSKPYITTGLVTGRALNEMMRGDYWDGTLQEDEVANVVIPPVDGPYTDETWNDLRVHCYNHIYGDDLLIFTTKPDVPDDQTAGPTADFGVDGTTPDLNHNLSDFGLSFTNNDDGHGNKWNASNSGYYSDPGTYTTTDGTKFTCRATVGPTFVSQADLILEGYVVNNDSAITFSPRLDNRAQSDTFPFSRLGNFPATDGDGNHDTLIFCVDGEVKWSTDNTDFTTEAEFLTFRDPITVTGIPAGKRIFRWTLKRYTSANDMAAWLDDVIFPPMLISDDINGVKRWFTAGGKVRRAKWWSFPKRDDDAGTDLSSRVSTVPMFITKDAKGRILYGNPHYVVRVLVDGIDDEANPSGILDETFFNKGFLRFTASPAIGPPKRFQDGNCEWVDLPNPVFDDIDDPNGFQILPFGDNGDFQLRGVNGSIQDATDDPLNLELYPKEEFAYSLNASPWNARACGWTCSPNDASVVPHLEIIWHPTHDQPAYPVAPDTDAYPDTDGYQAPPFAGEMQADSSVLAANQLASDPIESGSLFTRTREPNSFGDKITGDPDTRKPVWTGLSAILSRIYGDTYSLRPQFVWAKPWSTIFPDPTDPDTPPYPYPSVQWQLVVARHCPSAEHVGYNVTGPSNTPCHNDDGSDPDNWHYTWSLRGEIGSGFTDFDVVDEDCDCDCGE